MNWSSSSLTAERAAHTAAECLMRASRRVCLVASTLAVAKASSCTLGSKIRTATLASTGSQVNLITDSGPSLWHRPTSTEEISGRWTVSRGSKKKLSSLSTRNWYQEAGLHQPQKFQLKGPGHHPVPTSRRPFPSRPRRVQTILFAEGLQLRDLVPLGVASWNEN